MKFEEHLKTINEGLWDRTKANAAGAVGAVKGVGDKIAGTAIGALGGATNNQAAVQAGQAQKQRGKSSGELAKIDSYKATAQKKINKLSEEIFNDLKKLGIDIKLNPNAANGFTGQLNKGFSDLINNINTQNATSTTPAAAPASPAAAPATKLVSKAPASTAAPTPAPATPSAAAPASTPTPITSASTKTALDRGIAPATGTSAASPMSDEQIVADLNAKKADSYKDNNSLIMMAKQRAGETGVGSKTGAPKDGVELLKQELAPSDPIAQAKDTLAKQYNIDPKKLVELMSQVYTESKGIKKRTLSFKDLINKL
jgi:hypothetical protein